MVPAHPLLTVRRPGFQDSIAGSAHRHCRRVYPAYPTTRPTSSAIRSTRQPPYREAIADRI